MLPGCRRIPLLLLLLVSIVSTAIAQQPEKVYVDGKQNVQAVRISTSTLGDK